MDFKTFARVLGTIFMAELGDETQLALIRSSDEGRMGPFSLFTAASLGTGGSALNVAAGGYPSHNASVRHLQAAAGSGVIVIGARTLLQR